MHFSLVMATLGRKTEVQKFCEHLAKQTCKDFDLIVIDQNEEDFLSKILAPFSNVFEITHVHSSVKGLSYNRNIGLKIARGDIIAFPDDDCWYEPNTLEYIQNEFSNTTAGYLCVNSNDPDFPVVSNYGNQKNKKIYSINFYSFGISYTIFIKRMILGDFKFDEQLGCGAEFGAGEETDLLLYCLKNNALCIYDGNFFIHHPYKPVDLNNLDRSRTYALGFGAIHKKAVCVYKNGYAFLRFIVAIFKNLFGVLFSKNRKHHIVSLNGKVIGFVRYKGEMQ